MSFAVCSLYEYSFISAYNLQLCYINNGTLEILLAFDLFGLICKFYLKFDF